MSEILDSTATLSLNLPTQQKIHCCCSGLWRSFGWLWTKSWRPENSNPPSPVVKAPSLSKTDEFRGFKRLNGKGSNWSISRQTTTTSAAITIHD